jgi:hypothetical protein
MHRLGLSCFNEVFLLRPGGRVVVTRAVQMMMSLVMAAAVQRPPAGLAATLQSDA